MIRGLKKLAARLPMAWQQELKRYYFGWQIRRESFKTDEPEFERLSSMVRPGDWALDIGANIGHYSLRLSSLVGAEGRVISFEPVPDTFELLAAHAALAQHRNITLINAAASETVRLSAMDVPRFHDTGLKNYYMAQLASERNGSALEVLCLPVDSLDLPHAIRLVKIDAEGHELSVLRGMERLLARDHPWLILEDNCPEVVALLEANGYATEKIDGSCNRIFRPIGSS